MKTDKKIFLPSLFSLENKKLLLAFSGGIDSSALFYMLIDNGLKPDLAIVDYGIREQSKDELAYAKELALEYNCICHAVKAPGFDSHFEANARAFRYDFFEKLIKEYGYHVLLTAHQLNDQLEWLLMRLTKGAGVCELIGLHSVTQRSNYTIVRPLLEYSKNELQDYLDNNKYRYFIDESNNDESYERNYFRKYYSNSLISKYKDGIKRSFKYLKDDIFIIEDRFETVFAYKELRVIKIYDTRLRVKAADIALKGLGYLLSSSQREEIEKNDNLVIGGVWAIGLSADKLYIAPYHKIVLPKEFKEKCRVAGIPPLVRGYWYMENLDKITI
ncbi:MAG: tRNA lysidine(34) synthetase TilS [Sulfurovaceae bacterium]|nr:tRNA lysidine(34) synthetase TilS [Sulfurovaceae bacterium]